MATIPLSRGLVAVVDDADFEWLNRHKWHALVAKDGRAYAARNNRRDGYTYMHRAILNPPPGVLTDHKNGDSLDNRRENLRAASNSNNTANSRRSSANTSGFKGVIWLKRERRWLARVRINYRQLHIGTFTDREQAAHAYDRAALVHFGEFARLNFPAVAS